MSEDERDEELLSLLRKSPGIAGNASESAETSVIQDAEYIYNNSVDVAIDSVGTKAAATLIWDTMRRKEYSQKTWSLHELHPKAKDSSTVDFIFTMDLLNFCFWPEDPTEDAFTVDYKGSKWTGYRSLCAALQRALDDGIPITSPDFWQDTNECTDELLTHIFRSSTPTPIPLLEERISCLREAGLILYEKFDCSFTKCIDRAHQSAAALVNIIVENFPVFRDEVRFDEKVVRLYKRAQILVADLWAAFEGDDFGQFSDIDNITMFADYRVPQMLQSLGCLQYSPPLEYHIKSLKQIAPGHSWEVQLRGCSIWCVELIRRQILRHDPEASVNAILIDFFLYDMVKEREAQGFKMLPHHRTRSIWY